MKKMFVDKYEVPYVANAILDITRNNGEGVYRWRQVLMEHADQSVVWDGEYTEWFIYAKHEVDGVYEVGIVPVHEDGSSDYTEAYIRCDCKHMYTATKWFETFMERVAEGTVVSSK